MLPIISFDEIRSLLKQATTIAVVGLSPKEERPSNSVAKYLLDKGYTIYPVNPGHQSLLGIPCYPDINSLPGPVDIVDIFRKSEDVYPIVEMAVTKGCKAIWMQQGIINQDAARLATENGLQVIMDRCIKIDHAHLFPQN
jgi:predicted CoA-binding protein